KLSQSGRCHEYLSTLASVGVFAVNQVKLFHVTRPDRFVVFGLFMDENSFSMNCCASAPEPNSLFKLPKITCAHCYGESAHF
ncbi:MAG TPA: hypothetical protein VGV18_01830, partial [Verrucomicrobiae bacterium]|nr:hypothetical protein [Verrucomicrobiae bacterium]